MKGGATEAALPRLGDIGEKDTDLRINIYLTAYSDGSF